MIDTRSSFPAMLAVGGLAWALAVTLVATAADSDPVGAGYDGYNRGLTLALVFMAAAAIVLMRTRRGAATRVLAAGCLLMLVGNALEFWGSLVSGEPTAATAERLGTQEEFWGSAPGFGLFALGTLVLGAGGVALARSSRTWLIAAAGPLALASTGLWAVSPAAAAIPAVLFAFAWLALRRAHPGAPA